LEKTLQQHNFSTHRLLFLCFTTFLPFVVGLFFALVARCA
jgi:hypothetical protein